MAKVKKAQAGTDLKPRQYKRIGRIAEKNSDRAYKVADRMKTRASREERGKDVADPVRAYKSNEILKYLKENKVRQEYMDSKDRAYNNLNSIERDFKKEKEAIKRPKANFTIPKIKKAKNGKSFPDLNKDGKITKADILKGRGVIAKKGAKIKKAQAGLTASNKRVGPVDPKGAWTKVQEMNLPPRNVKTKVSLTRDKQLGATKMKSGGKMKKK